MSRPAFAARLALLAMLLAPAAMPQATAAPIDVYAAGDIGYCRDTSAAASDAARTAKLIPAGSRVLVLGDAAYPLATADALANCYAPTWGRHLATTWAVPGNHDFVHGGTADFDAYFGAGAGQDGHFARRLGDWLVIGLDSRERRDALDRQYAWLEGVLAANADAHCTLALWHAPMFSSGFHRGSGRHMRRFWERLDAHRADLVLNGHEHFYESFDPLDADGRPVESGIREFVVGTGGAWLHGFWRPPYQSRARILRHGVLRLELADDGYSWEFIDVNGRRSDAGRARCRAQ